MTRLSYAFASLLTLGAACTGTPSTNDDPELEGLAGLDEKSDAFSVHLQVLGTLQYGDTSDDVDYTMTPKYRGFRFSGRQGDPVSATVAVMDEGEARGWLLDGRFRVIKLASGDPDAVVTAKLPANTAPNSDTYYVVFREQELNDATLRVSLDGPAAPAGPQIGVGGDGTRYQAIIDCVARAGGGTPFDNGGGAHVHRLMNGNVQDFRLASDGTPAICMQKDGQAAAYSVRWGFRDNYFSTFVQGTSWMGYPKGDEYTAPPGSVQDFDTGKLTWNSSTGVITIVNPTNDPFAASSCLDAAMTQAQAANRIGFGTTLSLGTYTVKFKSRPCNRVTGVCGPWADSARIYAGSLNLSTSTPGRISVSLADNRGVAGCRTTMRCGDLGNWQSCTTYRSSTGGTPLSGCSVSNASPSNYWSAPFSLGGTVGATCTRLSATSSSAVQANGSYEEYQAATLVRY